MFPIQKVLFRHVAQYIYCTMCILIYRYRQYMHYSIVNKRLMLWVIITAILQLWGLW